MHLAQIWNWRILPCMAGWMRERIEELRREIADIQDANRRYQVSIHNHMTEQAYENRRLRLVEIMRELEAIQRHAA
jgi:hypothetical protein